MEARELVNISFLRGDAEIALPSQAHDFVFARFGAMFFANPVAALGHLEDSRQAAGAVRGLMQKKPEFSLEFAREHMFYLKQTDQLETYIDGLRKAGVS